METAGVALKAVFSIEITPTLTVIPIVITTATF
jgi:hypothetical protein